MKLTKIMILLVCLLPGIAWSKGPPDFVVLPSQAQDHAQGKPFLSQAGTIPEPEILSLFLAAGIAAFAMKAGKRKK